MPANYPGNATPATSTPWAAATHFALNSLIIPTAPHLTGYYYKATSVSGTATTGAVEPTYPTIIGATVTDNAGANQIIWTCFGTIPSLTGPVAIQSPIDSDTAGSSSTAVPVDSLSDWVAFIIAQAGLLALNNTWTGSNTFASTTSFGITATGFSGATGGIFNGGSAGGAGIFVTGGGGTGKGALVFGCGSNSLGAYPSPASTGVGAYGGAGGPGLFGVGGATGATVGVVGQGGNNNAGSLGGLFIGGTTAGSAGLSASGGSSGGDGVQGQGINTGAGGRFNGGGSAGTGIVAIGGAGGGGIGVIGTGGTGSAPGGQFTGTGASAGLVASSSGTGPGAQFTGNASSAALYLVPQAGLPSSPSEGYVSYNSTTHHLEYYNGTAWVSL